MTVSSDCQQIVWDSGVVWKNSQSWFFWQHYYTNIRSRQGEWSAICFSLRSNSDFILLSWRRAGKPPWRHLANGCSNSAAYAGSRVRSFRNAAGRSSRHCARSSTVNAALLLKSLPDNDSFQWLSTNLMRLWSRVKKFPKLIFFAVLLY